jgi:hypothetical protein
MKRHLDQTEMAKWKARVGGWKAAARLIEQRLECSSSKAEKLVAGSYQNTLTTAEQEALSALMNRPRDTVFPLAATRGRRRAG